MSSAAGRPLGMAVSVGYFSLLIALNAAVAQSRPADTPAFEVATIKPGSPDREPSVNFTLGAGETYRDTAGVFDTRGISLLDYIRFAYKLTDGQVDILRRNAPGWIETEHFDVLAKSSQPHPTKDDMRTMVRLLLKDRFDLRTHLQTTPMPVLALVQARPGNQAPDLRPHMGGTPCAPPAASTPTNPAAPAMCGGLQSFGVPSAPSRVRLVGSSVSISALAAQLGQMGGFTRPVVDATGLPGTYDLTLEWGPALPGEPADETSRETYLQEALRQQLGLKLERRTAPVTTLQIDHINPTPSEN